MPGFFTRFPWSSDFMLFFFAGKLKSEGGQFMTYQWLWMGTQDDSYEWEPSNYECENLQSRMEMQ